MFKLEHIAVTNTQYKIFILLIMVATILPAAIFMAVVMKNNLVEISRMHLILILAATGIMAFFLLTVIIRNWIRRIYMFEFDSNQLRIRGDSIDIYSYDMIQNIRILNNTDYANIQIQLSSGIKHMYHIGIANLPNGILVVDDIASLTLQLHGYLHASSKFDKGRQMINFTTK